MPTITPFGWPVEPDVYCNPREGRVNGAHVQTHDLHAATAGGGEPCARFHRFHRFHRLQPQREAASRARGAHACRRPQLQTLHTLTTCVTRLQESVTVVTVITDACRKASDGSALRRSSRRSVRKDVSAGDERPLGKSSDALAGTAGHAYVSPHKTFSTIHFACGRRGKLRDGGGVCTRATMWMATVGRHDERVDEATKVRGVRRAMWGARVGTSCSRGGGRASRRRRCAAAWTAPRHRGSWRRRWERQIRG